MVYIHVISIEKCAALTLEEIKTLMSDEGLDND